MTRLPTTVGCGRTHVHAHDRGAGERCARAQSRRSESTAVPVQAAVELQQQPLASRAMRERGGYTPLAAPLLPPAATIAPVPETRCRRAVARQRASRRTCTPGPIRRAPSRATQGSSRGRRAVVVRSSRGALRVSELSPILKEGEDPTAPATFGTSPCMQPLRDCCTRAPRSGRRRTVSCRTRSSASAAAAVRRRPGRVSLDARERSQHQPRARARAVRRLYRPAGSRRTTQCRGTRCCGLLSKMRTMGAGDAFVDLVARSRANTYARVCTVAARRGVGAVRAAPWRAAWRPAVAAAVRALR